LKEQLEVERDTLCSGAGFKIDSVERTALESALANGLISSLEFALNLRPTEDPEVSDDD